MLPAYHVWCQTRSSLKAVEIKRNTKLWAGDKGTWVSFLNWFKSGRNLSQIHQMKHHNSMKKIWWFLYLEHCNGSALTMKLFSFLLNYFLVFKLLFHKQTHNTLLAW